MVSAGHTAAALLLLGFGLANGTPAGCYSDGECLGGEILGTDANSSSLTACIDLCEATQGCISVTYFSGNKP